MIYPNYSYFLNDSLFDTNLLHPKISIIIKYNERNLMSFHYYLADV